MNLLLKKLSLKNKFWCKKYLFYFTEHLLKGSRKNEKKNLFQWVQIFLNGKKKRKRQKEKKKKKKKKKKFTQRVPLSIMIFLLLFRKE